MTKKSVPKLISNYINFFIFLEFFYLCLLILVETSIIRMIYELGRDSLFGGLEHGLKDGARNFLSHRAKYEDLLKARRWTEYNHRSNSDKHKGAI